MEQDFVDLYNAHFGTVLRFVERRAGGGGDAEDITVETFAAAWGAGSHVEVTLPWLFTVARNKIKDYYRANARRREAEGRVMSDAIVADEDLAQIERLAVREAVASLTPRERDVVELTYWDDLSAEQVAEVLGCKVGAVWTALSRGRASLRGLLRQTEGVGEIGG
nr:sigma-70 family RNA polymerase sigma factor [Microbacterium luticocti]